MNMDEMNIDGDENVQINAEGDVVSAVGDNAMAIFGNPTFIEGITPEVHAELLSKYNDMKRLYTKLKSENDERVKSEVAKQITSIHEKIGNERLELSGWDLTELGKIARLAGLNDKAKGNYQQALRKFEATKDKRGIYSSLLNIGNIELIFGSFETAMTKFMKVQYLAHESGDPFTWVKALTNIAIIEKHFGNLARSEEIHNDILRTFADTGNIEGEAITLQNLGNVQLDMGNYNDAKNSFEKSISKAREVRDYETEAAAHTSLATLFMSGFRDYQNARNQIKLGIELCKKENMHAIENELKANLGILEKNAGNSSKAKQLIIDCLDFERKSGNLIGQAKSLAMLGVISFEEGDLSNSMIYYMDSLKIFNEKGDSKSIAEILNNIGNLNIKKSDFEKAEIYLTQSLQISAEIGSKSAQINPLINLGDISKKLGKFAQAEAYFIRAIRILSETGQKTSEADLQLSLGMMLANQKRYDAAANCFKRNSDIWKELGETERMDAALSDYYMMIDLSKIE